MRLIFKIAWAELCKLFSSPVAWLILFVFAIQFGIQFCGILIRPVKDQALGNPWYGLTSDLFWDRFSYIRGYLYFYIPLLTMGLMSKEYGSGSIKLLFSSPVTDFQIIWGKYLSMMLFGLLMLGMLVPYVVFAACVIEHIDYGYLFSNFLGLYLLICTYAAVGLFVSSLTSNQVVAAIGTLAVVSFLSLIGKIGTDVPVVQDITYWLSFSRKSKFFIDGLVCSEHVIYFLTVTGFFLILTYWRVKRMRVKQKFTGVLLKYAGLLVMTVLIGYVASRPACTFYWDTTYNKSNTISPVTRKLIEALDGELKLVTYVNVLGKFCDRGLPASHSSNFENFRKYIRFKPDLKMEYVYYYDGTGDPYLDELYPDMTDRERAEKICRAKKLDFGRVLSPEELYRRIDLSEEKGRLVYQFVWRDSISAFLRLFDDDQLLPQEMEFAVVFKRLLSGPVRAGFLTGHGERSLHHTGDAGFYRFSTARTMRQALINQGYDIFELNLETDEIPGNTDIVVVADPQKSLSESELQALKLYLRQGGDMLVLGEPGRQAVLNPLLDEIGVHLADGCLMQQRTGNFSSVIASSLPME
ncbi:MAG: Gldg family protein, partial [Odoribacter sp.]|nr:Gldg family protein [Odoribacter sp.]